MVNTKVLHHHAQMHGSHLFKLTHRSKCNSTYVKKSTQPPNFHLETSPVNPHGSPTNC
ncbi:hypothetical protein SK128_001274, partial [Halocaridina rubra]